MTNPDIISNLYLARQAGSKKDIENSKKYYEKTIQLAEEEFRKEKSETRELELLTIKSEYFTFLAGFIFQGETEFDARNRAIKGLNLHHEALEKNTNSEKEKTLKENERTLLNQTIKVFGCNIPENETHYLFRCPIRTRDLLPQSGISPSIIFKDPTCNICNKPIINPECTHLLGEKYGDIVADIIFSKMEMVEVSLVDKPRDPNSRVETVYIPKEWIDKQFSQEELTRKEKGAGMKCHYCKDMKVTPNEIGYDLFTDMQKRDEISVPSNKDPNDRRKLDIKKDGLYFRTVIPMQDFLEPAKESAKMIGKGLYKSHFADYEKTSEE